MAFQSSTPEEEYRDRNLSIGVNASSLIAFNSIVEFTGATIESTTPLTISSDTPLTRETFPTSEERCRSVPATPAAYIRGASLRSREGCQYFPSSREYDDNHPSLDAHSASLAEEDLAEYESFKRGECVFCFCAQVFFCWWFCNCLRMLPRLREFQFPPKTLMKYLRRIIIFRGRPRGIPLVLTLTYIPCSQE